MAVWVGFEVEKFLENGCLSWLRLQQFRKQFENMERVDVKVVRTIGKGCCKNCWLRFGKDGKGCCSTITGDLITSNGPRPGELIAINCKLIFTRSANAWKLSETTRAPLFSGHLGHAPCQDPKREMKPGDAFLQRHVAELTQPSLKSEHWLPN